MIESYARGIFSKMQRENFSEMEVKQCACRLAYYLSEVNALHPFREGNGRSTRLFFQIFADKHGWTLSFEKISHVTLVEAMIESMNGDKIRTTFPKVHRPLQIFQTKAVLLLRLLD